MASPFAIFRKNQKVMYALLAIMCMVGFSIGGAIDYSSNMRSSEDPVVATAFGKSIRANELQQLIRRKQLAITFIDRCQRAEFNFSDQIDEGMAAQLMQMMGRPTGALYFGQTTDEGAVQTWILDERARQMGLVVSDSAINTFLRELTSNKVNSQVFSEIAMRMGVGQPQLFEALRAEITALRLREMALGRMQTTPAQRWDYYRRQRQRATVELVALPVEDFIGEVADATTEELHAFFDAHKEQEPQPDSPIPGFKVPKKAAFQVVVAKFDDFYDEKGVTDKEIKKHYEDFKDTRYLWEDELEGDDDEPAKPDAKAAEGTDEKPADEGADKETPDAKKAPAADSDAKSDSDAGAAEPDKKPAAKPNEKSQSSTGAADRHSLALAPVANPLAALGGALLAADADEKAPDGDQPKPEASDDADNVPGPEDVGQDDVGKKAVGKKTVSEKTVSEKTVESDKQSAAPGKEGEGKSADKKGAAKKTPVAPPIIEEFTLPRDIRQGEKPKHMPLWRVEDRIRKEVAREKANKKIEQALGVVRNKMRAYSRSLGPDEAEEQMPNLKKIAAAQGLTEQDTGLLTAHELNEKFPELAMAQGDQRSLPFVQIAYTGMAEFQSTTVQDIVGNRYLVWKTEEQEAYVPDFADARSKALRVWKLIKARDLATEKAKELAAEANESHEPLKKLFEGRQGLVVSRTQPFSWLTRGSANADNRAPPRLSEVDGVQSPGPEFMRAVFSLGVGAAGEAMNAPQTIAYVVRLDSLDPTDERLRTTFLADPFPLYNEVARDDIAEFHRAWLKGIENEAKLTWKEVDKKHR
ncbi:MAG TPA: hypothetical protein VHC22_20585 [Pirellulales bacterium]|nr:hypothetical protein [Pirellulales bacterium]